MSSTLGLDFVSVHRAGNLILLSGFGEESVAWCEDFVDRFSVDSEGGFEGKIISGELVEFEGDRLE